MALKKDTYELMIEKEGENIEVQRQWMQKQR